jgi:hypothetical protein
LENVSMKDRYSSDRREEQTKMPGARYSYYRRCQIFRKGGEQCKAPAEKGSHICYAHAGQLATAVRRERERRAVLAEAVAEMRQRGRPEFEMADLFTDFKGINVTLAVMARALIDGRIDCKTAGRLVVYLQTISKLLRMVHRTKTKNLPLINIDNTDLKRAAEEPRSQICAGERRLSNKKEQPGLRTIQTALPYAIARDTGDDSRVVVEAKMRRFPENHRDCRDGRCRDGPWQQARAA